MLNYEVLYRDMAQNCSFVIPWESETRAHSWRSHVIFRGPHALKAPFLATTLWDVRLAA